MVSRETRTTRGEAPLNEVKLAGDSRKVYMISLERVDVEAGVEKRLDFWQVERNSEIEVIENDDRSKIQDDIPHQHFCRVQCAGAQRAVPS